MLFNLNFFVFIGYDNQKKNNRENRICGLERSQTFSLTSYESQAITCEDSLLLWRIWKPPLVVSLYPSHTYSVLKYILKQFYPTY